MGPGAGIELDSIVLDMFQLYIIGLLTYFSQPTIHLYLKRVNHRIQMHFSSIQHKHSTPYEIVADSSPLT